MAHYTAAEMDAREAGASAFEEGQPRTANPHSMLSHRNLWQCWDDGWEEAHDEAHEEDDDDDS